MVPDGAYDHAKIFRMLRVEVSFKYLNSSVREKFVFELDLGTNYWNFKILHSGTKLVINYTARLVMLMVLSICSW